jgi:O-antigen ligase
MSMGAVTIIMTGASLVTFAVLFSAVKEARRHGDFDASAVLTLGMGLVATVPVAIVALTGGLVRRPDVLKQLVAFYPGWYSAADKLAKLLLVAVALVLIAGRLLAKQVPVQPAGLAAIVVWAIAQMSGALRGGSIPPQGSFVLLVCLVAATVLPRGRGASLGAGVFGVGLAAASGIFALFSHNVAFIVPCEGACSGLGFTGLLPNENLFGAVLVICIPFVFLGFRGRARFWLALYLAGMAAATGSRTAEGAALLSLVALLVVRPSVDPMHTNFGKKASAWALLGGAVATVVFMVRHHWDPSALTTRPQLWSVASDYISHSPWFGYGPTRWASLYDTSEIPLAAQHTSHNLLLDVLFNVGVVGALVFVALLVVTLATAGRARTGVVLTIATVVLVGTTEGSWTVGTFDLLSFSLVALILTGPGRAVAEAPAPVVASSLAGRAVATPRRLSYPRLTAR